MLKEENDTLQRFMFEQHDIRGVIVHLDDTYLDAIDVADYQAPVKKLLGEALSALCLLSCRMKFDGVVTLQIKTEGPLEFLIVQAKDELILRGSAGCNVDEVLDDFAILTGGEGTLAVNIDHKLSKEPYQGVINLTGNNLSDCVTEYLKSSEQLDSQVWLFAGEDRAAGLMLQKMPVDNEESASAQEKYWQHLLVLTNTITKKELLGLSKLDTLHRLYHEETVKCFDLQPISYRCFCTQHLMESALRVMPYQELLEMLEDEPKIKVKCEFCHKSFSFDRIDITRIYRDGALPMSSQSKH